MCKHPVGEGFHVVWSDEGAAVGDGPRFGGLGERARATHADPHAHLAGKTGGLDQAADVVVDERIHEHTAGDVAHAHERLRSDDGGKVVAHIGGALENANGRGQVGVAERGLHHEPVELGLWQPVGTGLLDRVLGGDDQKWHTGGAGDAVDGDVTLFHRFEQRRLRLGAGPVDLVGEHDVGEDRSAVKLELAGLLVVDGDARHVAGQQVGGELDAGRDALHGLRHGAGERGLAGARVVLEQQMAFADHRGEGEFDHVALAENDLFHVVDHHREGRGEPV